MGRYVCISQASQDAKALAAAKRAAKSHGATVVKSLAGTMLLEVSPATLPEVAKALSGWRISPERVSARVPERQPLESAQARGAADRPPARRST